MAMAIRFRHMRSIIAPTCWALHSLNLTRVIAVASVGGIRADFTPGMVAIPDQIIDYTHGRKYTYYEGVDKPVTHIDFTEPYCQITRKCLLEAAKWANEKVIDGGVYGATQGPRLETAAEINRLERDGVDMVGMTGMPEAALAKELGLCYAAIAVVANYAAGRKTSAHAIKSGRCSCCFGKSDGECQKYSRTRGGTQWRLNRY